MGVAVKRALLLLLISVPVLADQSMRFYPEGLTQTAGDARYQRLAANNTISAFDIFSGATNGVCVEDADQCMSSDGAGGWEFRDETGAVIFSVDTTGAAVAANSFEARGSAVAADFTCASNQDCRLNAAGTGSVQLMSGDNLIDILDSAGTTRGTIQPSATGVTLQATSGGRLQATTSVAVLTNNANVAAATLVGGVQDNGGELFSVYGSGTMAAKGGAALSITSPTDTATSPLGGSTECLMSSSGAAAWTPSETGAVVGQWWCCTNTGSNNITMTDSDGVYEGPGSVVGQYDSVCFAYIGDRFIERSFSNNEP